MPRCARVLVISVMIVAMLLALTGTETRANGTPVDIFLDYIPGVSNWGPQTATGRAVVAVGEGEVKLETKGLPRLQGEHYQVWLERADMGDLVSIGAFNSDENGRGELHILIDDLPYATYRMMIISVEPTPDADPAPSAKRSLVGRFPNMEIAREALKQPAQSGWSGSTASQPEFLPVTGGSLPAGVNLTVPIPWPASRWLRLGVSLLVLAVGGVVTAVWLGHHKEAR